MKKDIYFLFYGKILGLWCELDFENIKAFEESKITPAATLKRFKENVRKAYPDYKVIFIKVG